MVNGFRYGILGVSDVPLGWAYAIIFRTVAFGDPLFEPRRLVQAALFILALAGAAKDSPRWQAVVLILYLVAWIRLLAFRLALGAGFG